ncbi:MAG: hypothetical protein NTZ49_01665 [Candidatus Parcubacteria bacterium]|nr:hypothetical protein [Candidatus Parcubacteria bacterium]
MSKASKLARQARKNGQVMQDLQTQEGMVRCVYCNTVGHRDEITIDPDTDAVRKTFHALPRPLSGSTEGIQAVCIYCTFTHRQDLRKQFPEWFTTHKNLPVYVHLLEQEIEWGKKYPPAMKRVNQYMEQLHIVPNSWQKCHKCGKTHGEVFMTSFLPNLQFRCANVAWVLGFHQTLAEVMEHLICQDCRETKNQEGIRTFYLERTLDFLSEKEARIKRFYLHGKTQQKNSATASTPATAKPQVYKGNDPKYRGVPTQFIPKAVFGSKHR